MLLVHAPAVAIFWNHLARLQKVAVLNNVDALLEKYEHDKDTIMNTLGISESEAWRALRHFNWCAPSCQLHNHTACPGLAHAYRTCSCF